LPSVFDNAQLPGSPTPASYQAPNMGTQLFSMISSLPDSYYQGAQQARTLRLQNQFKEGLPLDKDGNVDIEGATNQLIKTGGADYAREFIPFLYDLRNQTLFNQRFTNPGSPGAANFNGGAPQQNVGPGSSPHGQSPDMLRAAAAGQGQGQGQGQPRPSSVGTDTTGLNRIAVEHGVDLNDFLGAFPGFRGLLNRDVTPEQEANVVRYMSKFKGGGDTTPVGTGGGRSDVGSTAVSPMPQSGYRPSPLGGLDEADRHDQAAAYYAQLAATPRITQQQAQIAREEAQRHSDISKQIRESTSAFNLPTPDERNAARSGMTPLTYEGQKAEATSRATEDTKYMGDLAKQGFAAQSRDAQLDAVDELGRRAGYGLGAKFTEFLGEKLGIPLKGYDDIRAYTAAINYLSPQLRPEGSGRLIEWELQGFKDSLGGLMTTPEGRRVAIQNLKLVNQYSVGLGKIANDPNMSNAQKRSQLDTVPVPKLALPVRSADEYAQLPVGHPYLDMRPGPNQGAVLRKMPPRQQAQQPQPQPTLQ
jgi:hypothetical protein